MVRQTLKSSAVEQLVDELAAINAKAKEYLAAGEPDKAA